MKQKRKTRKSTIYIRGISDTVKDHFKAWCARRHMTMSHAIETLMRLTANQDDPISPNLVRKMDNFNADDSRIAR